MHMPSPDLEPRGCLLSSISVSARQMLARYRSFISPNERLASIKRLIRPSDGQMAQSERQRTLPRHPDVVLPIEIRLAIAQHCSQDQLYSLALTNSFWLAPCEEILYQHISVCIDLACDVSKFVQLFRRLAQGLKRAERVETLYVDVKKEASNRCCRGCAKEFSYWCADEFFLDLPPSRYEMDENNPSGPAISNKVAKRIARRDSRSCYNYMGANKLIVSAAFALALPRLSSLRVLCLFPSLSGYNSFLDLGLRRYLSLPGRTTLQFVHLHASLLDLQLHPNLQPLSNITPRLRALIKALSGLSGANKHASRSCRHHRPNATSRNCQSSPRRSWHCDR
ncbi:hypothetical protein BKA62DRAFT_65506 [Auriculariales sp. MPI-PUGE-AT-0066]|nr:hypothetical protein BKA62DRAFT_65506 [Auriculariales sp. MPI-PUGE-AT-0066]